MNWKTTIALLLLAGGTVALFWKGPEWFSKSAPASPPPKEGSTLTVLEGLTADKIARIEIRAGGDPVVLAASAPGKPLELPGNWPVRAPEVTEVVQAISSLKTRFNPLAIAADAPLQPYGLDASQKPVTVEVDAGEKHTLVFGQPDAAPGENPFTRPTYLQVDGKPELVRLGPDVLPILRRPVDFYRKRQVFPDVVRVKIADSAPGAGGSNAVLTPILDKVTEISVDGPSGSYVLGRVGPTPEAKPQPDKPASDAFITNAQLADVWRLDYPVSDRIDPAKLKSILAAIPDLWVERFVSPPDVAAKIANVFPSWLSGVDNEKGSDWFLENTGLRPTGVDTPLELSIREAGGSARRLIIGKVSRSNTRVEPAPPPQFPGQPPGQPRIITEEYRYAKLADNPLVFEVRGDKLKDIFFQTGPPPDPFSPPPAKTSAVEELRDPNLVRFEQDQVTQVEVERPGRQPLILKKTKGDPKAASAAAKRDRWDVLQPFAALAESNQVNDLIRPFENMKANKGDIVDRKALHALTGSLGAADLLAFGLDPSVATRVQITTDKKEMTLLVGRHDPVKKKLLVRVAGWDRINVVDDSPLSQLDKQARAFRSLKLFDLGDNRVASVSVTGRKGEKFELTEIPGLTATWKLMAPVQADADATKAGQIARELGDLQVQEYVHEPTANEIAASTLAAGSVAARVGELSGKFFGLNNETINLTIHFAGPNPPPDQTLTIGKAREGKSEFYARSADATRGVFTVSKNVVEDLEKGSLGLLPLQQWQGVGTDVQVIEIQRGKEEPFTLTQEGSTWKITAPLQATVDAGLIQPLASALASVRAERFEAHSTQDLAAFGLNPPVLRVKFRMKETKPAVAGEERKEEVKERVLLIGNAEPAKKEEPKKEEHKKDDPFKKDEPLKKDEPKPGRYAKLEGDANPAVFVVADSLFREADKSLLDLLDRKLLTVSAAAVTKLQSGAGDNTVTLVKDKETWKPEGTAFVIDKPTIDAVLRVAGNLSAARYADYGSKVEWAKYGLDPKDKPASLVITEGDKSHKIELGKPVDEKQSDGERYARIDGGQGVAVLAAATARELSKGRLDFVDRSLLKFDVLDLQTVKRTMGKDELELKQGATGGWEILKPTAQRGDAESLEELATRLATLRAERIAAVDAKDLKPFGLDAPAAVVKLELTAEKPLEKVLKIGKPVDDKQPDGERFAQVEGSTAVAVLPAALSRKLTAEPIKFRDRGLASFVNADKIVIEYDQPTGPRQVTFTKGAGGWKLTAPAEADAEDEALRDVHDTLARLKAEEFVADKPSDLKPFGLDKPKAKWKLYSGEKEVLSLLVGAREKIGEKKDRDGFRAYAKLEKGDAVVLLDMALTGKLSAEYRKRTLWEPLDVAQAAEIKVQTPDGGFTLTKGAIGWTDPAKPMERLSSETVNDFLDAVASLKAERWVADKSADPKLFGLDPPQRTITVTTQTGTKRTVLLGRTDESKRAYAKSDAKDCTDVFLLSERDTTRLTRDRAGFGIAAKEEPKKEEPKKKEPKKEEPKKAEEKKEEPKKEEPKKE